MVASLYKTIEKFEPLFSLLFPLIFLVFLLADVPSLKVIKVSIQNNFTIISFIREEITATKSEPTPIVVFNGPREKKNIALSFDADMTGYMKEKLTSGQVQSWYNSQVVELLNQTQTQATIFLTGMWIEVYPQVSKYLAGNNLFELGNHSYSHPAFSQNCFGLPTIDDSQDKDQIQKTQQLLTSLTGKENKLFRFPGGCYEEKDLEIATSFGLKVIQWDVVGGDSFSQDSERSVEKIARETQNGSIIVLHLNGGQNAPKTAEILGKIIPILKGEGFAFVKISELID